MNVSDKMRRAYEQRQKSCPDLSFDLFCKIERKEECSWSHGQSTWIVYSKDSDLNKIYEDAKEQFDEMGDFR